MECDLILPCRDEGPALGAVLAALPLGVRAIVVDNRSVDDTAEVAERGGALLVREPTPGYGAAVHAGLLAASHPVVAVHDGDGSIATSELAPLVADVVEGRADLALGRRLPAERGAWPWPARVANAALAWHLRRRTGLPVRDLGPVRVCRREALLALGVRDRRFGYPVELLQRAARSGWRVTEHPVTYRRRAPGTRSKVSGSVRGSLRTLVDLWRVLR